MKSFIGTPKAQPLMHTIHRNLLQVKNTKSAQIYLDLKQNQVSFGRQEQAKAFTSLFSPHAED